MSNDHNIGRCKTKWLDSLSGYNADTEVQPNFIKNTFGFDFSKLQNVLITSVIPRSNLLNLLNFTEPPNSTNIQQS